MKKLLALVLALALVLTAATVLVSAEEVSEPEAYLVLKTEDSTEPSVSYTVSGDKLTGPVDIEALVYFGEDCAPNPDGSVYLNIYPWDESGNLLNWTDYAKHSTVELGKWTVVTLTGWDCTKGGVSPAYATLTTGIWHAVGTVKVAYVKASVAGEVIFEIDYADGFDLADASGSANITDETKGVNWDYVAATVPVEESKEESKEEPATESKEVNYAAGKSYTVAGDNARTDGYADSAAGKLTDGVKIAGGASTDCLGFQGTVADGADAAAVTVVIDLGESKSFTKISTDILYGDWGIAAPTGVKFAVSEDGTTFGEEITVLSDDAATLDGFTGNWVGILFTAEGAFTGRYVKVTYYKPDDGQSNHIWTSEIEVIGEEAAAPVEESQAPVEESQAPVEESQAPVEESKGTAPKAGDAGIIALAVVSAIALGGAVIVKKSK